MKFCLINKKYEILSDEDLNKYDNEKNGILNILLNIQALMKQEIILILKNLEILYPSLYELFNKNFSEYGGGKKFVRISYESSYSYVEVNENFKMIVLVSKDKLDEEQKPFLNRFEKYLFTLPNIFKNKKDMIDKYNNYINNFNQYKTRNNYFNYNHINESLPYILMAENNKKNFEEKFIPLFTQEMIYWLIMTNNDKYNYKQDINNIYEKNYKNNYNLIKFLSNFNSDKNIIYTYSNIENKLLNNNDNIENHKMKTVFSKEKARIIDLNISIEEIEPIFKKEEFNLYLIKINEEEIINKIDNVINLIENVEKYNNNKIVVYIIYKKRQYKNDKNNEKIRVNNVNKILV